MYLVKYVKWQKYVCTLKFLQLRYLQNVNLQLATNERIEQLQDITDIGNDLELTDVIVSVAVLLTTTDEVSGNLSVSYELYDAAI